MPAVDVNKNTELTSIQTAITILLWNTCLTSNKGSFASCPNLQNNCFGNPFRSPLALGKGRLVWQPCYKAPAADLQGGRLTARHLNAFTGRRELAPAEQHVLGSAEPEQGFLQTVPVSSGAQEVWGKEGERLKCLRMERGDLLKTLAEAEVSKATKRQ